jgi:hypothetical protein|tara:strand:+ start:6145 stop:6588 length:444 start_codon:yes stop_codon:yes gene_type:complete
MAESIKSIYKPSYPEKYKGDPNNIICRSSWERKFSYWCDHNENIISWASEEFCIGYISPIDNRVHRYFPDYLIKVKEKDGKIKTYVIEVKPKKQCSPPKKPKRQTKSYLYEMKTYAVNQAKWKAAKEWCDDRKLEFKIITEDELGIK